MTRFAVPLDSDLDPDQQRMAAVAQRGGPYAAFLQAPLLWERLQPVRRYLAEDGVLDAATREAVILTLARHWDAPGMANGHRALAASAGLAPAQTAALDRGDPVSLPGPAAQIALECARALLRHHRIDDALFARAAEAFGERGIVELIGLIGFFTTIALTLNVAENPRIVGDVFA